MVVNSLFEDFLDFVSPRFLLPFYERVKGLKRMHYVEEVERLNTLSPSEIHDYQLNRIRVIAGYAAKNSSYYRDLFTSVGISSPSRLSWEEFRIIPPLRKDNLRNNLARLICVSPGKERLRRTATGGTTSSPMPLYLDWETDARRRSATVAFDKWFGFRPGEKMVCLWQARQDFLNSISWKRRLLTRLVERVLLFPGSPLDDSIVEEFVMLLKSERPRLLQSYPGPLEIVARYLARTGQRVSLPAISVTAEPFLDHQRKLIREAFLTEPFNWYGSRENGRIATECKMHDGMHVNSYGNLVEVDAPLGQAGRILITDLWNRGTPLVRYEIGDVGVLDESPCGCGCQLPRLKGVVGRVSDTFVNSRGQIIPGVWFPNQFISDSDDVLAMQVQQLALRSFRILVVPDIYFDTDTERKLKDKLNEFVGEECSVFVSRVTAIPMEPSGKVRVCKNLMPNCSELTSSL